MSEVANAEQLAAWDGDEGEHWSAHEERYDTAIARPLRAPGRPGRGRARASRCSISGVAAARSTRDAARAAGDGAAVGIDLSSQMLDIARRRAAEEGLDNVSFVHGDAQVHAFPPATFDVVISRFGAMFFADPVAAFANVARRDAPRRARGADRLAGAAPATSGSPRSGVRWPRVVTCRRHRRACRGRSGSPIPTACARSWATPASTTCGSTTSRRRSGSAPTPRTRTGSSKDLGMVRGLLQDLTPDEQAAALGEPAGRDRVARRGADGVVFGSRAWIDPRRSLASGLDAGDRQRRAGRRVGRTVGRRLGRARGVPERGARRAHRAHARRRGDRADRPRARRRVRDRRHDACRARVSPSTATPSASTSPGRCSPGRASARRPTGSPT